MSQVDVLGAIFRDFLFYGNVHATEVLEMIGGTGFNVYAGLQSIGIESFLHAAGGYDNPLQEGVTIKQERTGIFVCRNEKEALAVFRGANLMMQSEPMVSKVLFATLECGGEIFATYAMNMKRQGGMVILDPTPSFEWKREWLEWCDVLLPNEKEFERLGKEVAMQKPVYLKHGIKGGSYLFQDQRYDVPIQEEGPFPLGCGDAFDVAVVYGLLHHLLPQEILTMAVRAGEKASFVKGSSAAVMAALKAMF
ncbi:MAG: carbohydrate kinase family protein [Microbacter sp.]